MSRIEKAPDRDGYIVTTLVNPIVMSCLNEQELLQWKRLFNDPNIINLTEVSHDETDVVAEIEFISNNDFLSDPVNNSIVTAFEFNAATLAEMIKNKGISNTFRQKMELILTAERKYNEKVSSNPKQIIEDVNTTFSLFPSFFFKECKNIDEISDILTLLCEPLYKAYNRIVNNFSDMDMGFYEVPETISSIIRATAHKINDNLNMLKANNEPLPDEHPPENLILFCKLPSSSPLSLFSDIAGSGKDFEKLPIRKAKYSHNPKGLKKAKNKDNGDPAISYSIGESKTVISIADMDKLTHNAHQRKLLRHLLRLANEQCCSNGIMSRYEIKFPLSDLVGDNLYKNRDTARRGFYTAMGTLQGLQITGKIVKKGKNGKEVLEQGERVNIFVKSSVKNGVCKVWLNPFMNWEYLFQFFTILPDYYLQLPDSSSDLLEHIFIQARQHGADIKAGKSFNLSFRSVCYKLNIPTEEEVANEPKYQRKNKQYIKEPLIEAISGLQAMNDSGYHITAHYDIELPISQFLDTGYIEISIKNDSPYFKPLTDMSRRKEQIIQQREEKAERIAAKAQAAIEEKKAKQDT